jgi:hypothetical protein
MKMLIPGANCRQNLHLGGVRLASKISVIGPVGIWETQLAGLTRSWWNFSFGAVRRILLVDNFRHF